MGVPPYLLLSVLDGQLEPVERHLLAVRVGGAGGVVVEQHLQLVRRPRVVQQRGRELLALVAQLLKKETFLSGLRNSR